MCRAILLVLLATAGVSVGQDFDRCSHIPCYNGGTCLPSQGVCQCPAGYADASCSTRITCSDPGLPANGSRTNSSQQQFSIGSTVTFSCQTGFTLSSAGGMECLPSGLWNGSVPSCSLVNCGDPGTPSNGVRLNSTFTYPHVVDFRCNQGYKLQNAVTSVSCQANGHWSGATPFCTAIQCPDPGIPENGVRFVNGVQSVPGTHYTFQVGDRVTYTCTQNAVIWGSAVRTCQSNGVFSGTPATCTDQCLSDGKACVGNKNNFTTCCQYNLRPIGCCRSPVQKILNNRWNNFPDPSCKAALSSQLGECASEYMSCLNNLRTPPPSYQTCPNSNGCAQACSASCNTSIIMDSGRSSNSSFCLPTQCRGKPASVLNAIAEAEGQQHCDTLEKLAGIHKCPLTGVKINCNDGSNGAFYPGGNPKPDSDNTTTIVAVVIALLALAILIITIIVVYKYKKKSNDSVDFAQLRSEEDGEDDED